ncbi:unnamed protein product [Adineta steineri]|uniref:DEPDC5 C-terminal domain-containing protein n=2 Tax=Adineta steineri TaxID=433720 RepID=A0A814I443_9BILA|nr:unnamed protein product [Adineta steineri]
MFDSKNISDRREWTIVHYHSFYNQYCLFELEIRWFVATSCTLGDLITQWSQRTGTIPDSNQVAFHLVPIPCDSFAEFDALMNIQKYISSDFIIFYLLNIRFTSTKISSIYKKINSLCLRDKVTNLPDNDQILRINIFQKLTLKRNEKIYYAHIGGGKKWQSSQTGGKKYQDIMLVDF